MFGHLKLNNLEPRSPTARQKGDLVKFDLEHAHRQQGTIYGPCCYCACFDKDVVNLRESSRKRTDFDNLLQDVLRFKDRNALKRALQDTVIR